MRVLFPLLLVAAATACARKHDVLVDNELDPGAPATVFVFEEPEAAAADGNSLRVRVPEGSIRRRTKDGYNTTSCLLPGCGGHDKPSGLFTVRIDTKACGSVDLCVGFADWRSKPAKDETLRGRLLWRKRAEYAGCTEEVHRLFVDNRGGASVRRLSVGGGASHAIAANAVTTIEVPAPPCAAMASLTLDGEVIGTLPTFPANAAYQDLRRRDFVVDPSASRCYAATRYSYTPNGGPGGASDPSTQWLEKAWLHAVTDAVDVPFLEKAPDRIDAYAGYGSRTQLVEAPCSTPSPP